MNWKELNIYCKNRFFSCFCQSLRLATALNRELEEKLRRTFSIKVLASVGTTRVPPGCKPKEVAAKVDNPIWPAGPASYWPPPSALPKTKFVLLVLYCSCLTRLERRHPPYLCVSSVWVYCRLLQAKAPRAYLPLRLEHKLASILGPPISFTQTPTPPIEIILKLCEQKAHIGTTNILHFSPVNKCSECFDLVLTLLAGLAAKANSSHQLFTPMPKSGMYCPLFTNFLHIAT